MTPTTEFKTAARAHTSFLAAAEKRTLIWIAKRLPAGVNSDHLTALGFVSLILAGASYWYAASNPWALLLVIPLLALNWFGDSLDGTLARVRNRQRPRYGFYVDHILDALGMSFLMAGMAFSGYLTPLVGGDIPDRLPAALDRNLSGDLHASARSIFPIGTSVRRSCGFSW